MSGDSRFPLGRPINRDGPPAAVPIKDRPNWFRDRNGKDFYKEPVKPKA